MPMQKKRSRACVLHHHQALCFLLCVRACACLCVTHPARGAAPTVLRQEEAFESELMLLQRLSLHALRY